MRTLCDFTFADSITEDAHTNICTNVHSSDTKDFHSLVGVRGGAPFVLGGGGGSSLCEGGGQGRVPLD